MDIACDYNQVLFHGRDPASDWLSGWAWQRGEQVERLLFQSLIQSGGQDAYVASRRFVIERPAGAQRALADERTTAPEYAGARLVTDYKPVPADRVYRFGGRRGLPRAPACGARRRSPGRRSWVEDGEGRRR